MTTNWSQQIERVAVRATARGAMVPLVSETRAVQQDGFEFLVSHLSSLSLKELAKILQQSTGANPFLPYEAAMFVAELSDTHVLLLNKFPVFPGHAMAVTRRFMPQTGVLDETDYLALARLMAGTPQAVFMFNAGKAAGASQPHRHLHLLPAHQLPLLARFPAGAAPGRLQQIPFFDFVHAYVSLADGGSEQDWARQMTEALTQACTHCGLSPRQGEMPPYNLLGTRRGVLVVPRRQEHWSDGTHSISVNALNFGGWVGVRGPEQIEPVCQAGLPATWRAVTQPLA